MQKEKEELRGWLTECIDKLQVQIDHFETEIEAAQAATKKKKPDKDVSLRVEEGRVVWCSSSASGLSLNV